MLEIPNPVNEEDLIRKIEHKGVKVVQELQKQLKLGGVVDEYLADQIVIFMALASAGFEPFLDVNLKRGLVSGRCEVLVGEVSSHALTAMRIAENMLGNIVFSTKKIEGVGVIMLCEQIYN